MGKKKQRSSSSGLKPPPSTTSSSSLMPPPSTTTTSTSKPPQHPPPESLDPVIFAEGSKVQDEIKAGNYPKASLTLRNLISLHKNSPHLLYLKAVVLQFLAKTTANASKQMIACLKEANELVELALKLLPNSIHFASCKIAILYLKTLIDDGDWGKVIEECKSALSLKIENLTDPGVDMFLQVNEMANSTKESRIEFERKMIEQYLKLCEEEHKQAENANKENADKAGDTLHEIKEEFETEIKSYHVFKKIKSHYGMEKYYEVNAVKKEEYKSLWNEFRPEGKRDFCEVSIKELERHWKSINFHLAGREAIDFAKKHKTWKGWECCGCNEKFGDLELYRKHSRKSHWKNLDAMELQFQIPGKVIEFIENGEWKPLNAEYWVKKIVSKMNSESCDGKLFDEESLKESLCESTGRKNNERELSERVKILKSIRGMFRLLHRYNCLAPSYLNCAVQFTVEQLTINFEDQRYFLQRLDLEAIQIICLLRAADLKKVREFLQEFTDAFGKFIKPKFVSPLDDNLSFVQVFNVNEKPGISEVLKSRLLDERFLEGADNLTLPDSQDLVTWLYEGTSIQVVLMAWSGLQDYQKQKSKEIFQILLKEYLLVEKLCDDPTYKRENTNLLKAIEAVESIKLEDIEGNESTTVSYFRLLKKRQKELVQYDDIASKKENNVIFEVITDMLDLAQSEGSSLTDNPNAFETFTDEAEMKMLESIEAGESAARFDLQSMRIDSLKKVSLPIILIMLSIF
ncbi:uncharacterized protein LOC123226372 [Mangifera indica]|uniref:uncharacterized protein LOC123226372 n=1 Tax=Mangifera indica TaxID=29780 RepID=UPI001CFAB7BF|nr:uncharacterized protein LOC123226372 [Mangifera indica]